MGVTGFSHIGLSVSDEGRSTSFYTNALGFERGERHELGSGFEAAADAPPLPVVCQFLAKDGVQIALLQYPNAAIQPVPRPMQHLGIANIGLHVDAIEPVIEKILAHGGQVHRETFLDAPQGQFIHCSDPDGARIELMCLAG